MTNEAVIAGIVAWVKAECNPVLVGDYDHMPHGKTEALPDVIVELADHRLTKDDPLFPMHQLQQRWIRIRGVAISIMVDNGDPQAAAHQLEGYADQLEAALRGDGSLGGRVPFVSPYISFDFTAPFVEYQDGTRGREMNVSLFVGELVEAPE